MDENKQKIQSIPMSSNEQPVKQDTYSKEIEILVTNNQSDIDKLKASMKKKCSQTTFLSLIIVVLVLFAGFLVYQLHVRNDSKHNNSKGTPDTSEIRQPQKRMAEALVGQSLDKLPSFLSIGMRNDYRLQECNGSHLKRSFPDVDYSLLGYDILKGFPQADQHDPGFTYPIFQAKYDNGRTADCRYSVPNGLLIIPDVSCDTSFSSKIIRSQRDLASSLSTSAEVSGGGWGVKFSASAGYKESSSSMARGEYVYINSQANCNYYYSRLIEDNPPSFDPTFLSWVRTLNSKNDLDTYVKFFSTYGTHYLTETTFGARFIKNYKMSTKEYQSQSQKGVNVAVSASYSGFISVGGGFSLDTSQQQAAKDFAKSVTSETKSVGAAPPANGDVMTWASSVQENPIPSGYKLSSIENLFTSRYMHQLSVNYNKIAGNIKTFKSQYCTHLKAIGEVDSCVALASALNIFKTKLQNPFKTIPDCPMNVCEDTCLKTTACEAITYCTKCSGSNADYRKCYMFSSVLKTVKAVKHDSYQSTIYRNTIIQDSAIEGQSRLTTNSTVKLANLKQCNTFLQHDPQSVAFTYRPYGSLKCQLYGWRDITNMIAQTRSSSTILLNV